MKNLIPKLIIIWLMAFIGAAPSYSQSCWLEARGSQIVRSENGQPVVLRSIGLGGWLLQEGYMLNPQGCDGCPGTQWQMKKQYYDQGQSMQQVEDFYQKWRDNFITKADIDYIASLGFNSVRLPMHYELFLTEEQRVVRNNVINNLNYGHDEYKAALRSWYNNGELFATYDLEGFRIIDKLIEWCADNGLYIILDLHAAPGAQGSDKNISDAFFANNLWEFPVFQDVTNQLWLRISEKYKAEPRIAFYDLINEPNNVPGGGQAIHSLFQRLISTIRNNGDNHMLMIEGNGWGNNYDYLEPFTFSPNWGLVYNAHRYWIDASDDWVPDANPNQINRMVNLINFRTAYNVPVWVGETGENNNTWLRQNIAWLEEYGIGWSHWTYKRHDVNENAALMRIGGNYPTDGASVMNAVLEHIKFENCIPNTNTISAVTETLPPPYSSGCLSGDDPTDDTEIPVGQTIWIRNVNGLYVSSENGEQSMMCDRTTPLEWEAFTVEDAGMGKVALRASNGMYVSSENGEAPMNCNREMVEEWELFTWVAQGNGTFALRGNNGMFVSSENGEQYMGCNRATASAWETFTWSAVSNSAKLSATTNITGSNINIYPNPADETGFRVEAGVPSTIKVYDLNGVELFSMSNINSMVFDTFPKGIYLVKVVNNDASSIRKIIVK